MKVTRDEESGRFTIVLTEKEADRLYSQAEYACRPDLDWTADVWPGERRFLNRINGNPKPLRQFCRALEEAGVQDIG